MENNTVHKRRVRYKGKNPRNFNEKYKELNPSKYQDTITHVIKKGNTPAGMHLPIMVNEILDILKIKENEIGLDATLGYGGHTKKMLEALNHTGHLYCLDVDSIEIEKTKERLTALGYTEKDLTIKHLNFKNIKEVSDEANKFDFILADLGVSSMQIDNPSRGFSFKNDGPLDLRLDQNSGVPANVALSKMTFDEIEGMLIENSDEPYAKEIAKEIDSFNKSGRLIETTKMLYNLVVKALKNVNDSNHTELIKKTCQRVFQAIRIDINSEFEVLYEFLENLPNSLKENGRVAILTFHSGEDRLVKKSFKQLYKEGVYKEIANEVIRPSLEECNLNPRATSTKLRFAIKS